MRQKWWTFTCIVCIVLLASCSSASEEITNTDLNEADETKINNDAHILTEGPTFDWEKWEHTYDLATFKEIINAQHEKWSELAEDESLKFEVLDKLDHHMTLKGEYTGVNQWKLTGVMENSDDKEKEVTLQTEDDHVLLTVDDNENKLSKAELSFLVPTTHINVLKLTMDEALYDYISLEPVSKEKFYVTIDSSARSVTDHFLEFLLEHLDSDEANNLPLDEYTLNYRLQIENSQNEWVITELNFTLNNNKSYLEQLSFIMYD